MIPDKQELEKLYYNEYKSLYNISEIYNVSANSVRYWMQKYGLERRKLHHCPEKYIGTQFGTWTFKKVDHKDNKNRSYYECECSCGNIEVCYYKNILVHNKKCRKCTPISCPKRKKIGYVTGTVWFNIISNANEKNIELNIDQLYINNLFIEQKFKCALSGLDIILPQTAKEKALGQYTASLDRKNSKIGYIKRNVQWIHKDLQFMKSAKDEFTFINWCHIISDYQRNKI